MLDAVETVKFEQISENSHDFVLGKTDQFKEEVENC